MEKDESYRKQVASHVLSEQDSTYDEVIFTPISSENPLRPNESHSPINDDKVYWHDAASKLMLSLIEELRPKLGKSIHVKNKTKMYKIVSEEMAKKNYNFSPHQIENKFRGLERQYKKMALNNKQTGRSRQTCSFESELKKILGENRAIAPEFVLESGDDEGISRDTSALDELSDDTDHSQKDDVPSCSAPPPKRRRQNAIKEQLLEKIEEMKEEKKDFHLAVLDLLKKKDEREEKLEKRSQKKLELLEMLVKQNKPT